MRSYKDTLPPHFREPLSPARTMKRAGDLVLRQSVGPADTVPGRKGRFAGYLA